MNFDVWPDGRLDIAGRIVPAALGRSGVRQAADKREGDGATPAGVWSIRRLLYRPDKEPPPQTTLPATAIGEDDGWCDAPGDQAYNRPVKLPYAGSAERLWREDDLYDLLLVLGHNDDPPVPGLGSAIFVHLQRPDGAATDGCIAIARPDMLMLIALARAGDTIEVHAQAEPPTAFVRSSPST
ncbi:MAG TPA: L,D-transpeptidase family protein [Caulobacteraceae bacterium]|nr:L,D-transpeptidase family protein [Caulobacteraceae bacterium]